jgi:hypothetical protein
VLTTFLAAIVLAAGALTLGADRASAAPGGTVEGLYSMEVTVSGTTTQYWLSIRSDSSWVFLGPQLIEGTWSASSNTYSFSQFWRDHCATFSGTLTSTGFNSVDAQGPFSGCAGPGTWYALRPALPTSTNVISQYPQPVVAGWLTVDVEVHATTDVSPLPVLSGNVRISNGTASCEAVLTAGAPGDATGGCPLKMKVIGKASITATYGGDGDYLPSAVAASTKVRIVRAASRTLLKPASPTVAYASETSDSFAASVTTQTGLSAYGRVTVMNGSTPLCRASLKSGQGTCNLRPGELAPGRYSLVAVWPGSAAIIGSTSRPVRLTVTP